MPVHSFTNKYRILVRLAILAIAAVPALAAAAAFNDSPALSQTSLIIAAFCGLPCVLYGYILTILHWKSRYQGENSDLWGILLIIQSSGLFQLIYFIRHVLPDMRGQGSYYIDKAVA